MLSSGASRTRRSNGVLEPHLAARPFASNEQGAITFGAGPADMRPQSNREIPSTHSTRANDRGASGATAGAGGDSEEEDAGLSEVSDTEESSEEEEEDVVYSPAARRGRRGSSNNDGASGGRVRKSQSPRKSASALRLAKEKRAKAARKAARLEQRVRHEVERRAIRFANKRNRSRGGGVSVPASQGGRTGAAGDNFIHNRSVNRITFDENTLPGSPETPTRNNRGRQALAEIDPAMMSGALPNQDNEQDRLRRQIALVDFGQGDRSFGSMHCRVDVIVNSSFIRASMAQLDFARRHLGDARAHTSDSFLAGARRHINRLVDH
ncbi:unnamed protein product [Zymoseptoria tritici ST99CH_3D1]|uniref:Uncharacterized protein n=2 Tax=Zymoseptoria tritici TaxID=1047171 RepID=A0A1X7RVR4_ZYMT9|nr:unnamed protein product [Zymoseptoria tritici ST99CH_3D7]SMR55983.1 unnamed protein product [Zymoseptoria tritici ST99CH_3D1]